MSCPVRNSIDYEANVIKVSFPRRCVSNPRWIKFWVLITVHRGQIWYHDNALLDGAFTGPRLFNTSSDRVHRTGQAAS